jgi:hypothetical protein
LFDYAGGSNLTYIGYALSNQHEAASTTESIASATNANPVVFTVTGGHGFDYQSGATILPVVCVSGGTGNWTAVNGCFVGTPTASTTFSIPVNSTSFGAVTGTLVLTTNAPLTTKAIWAIEKFVYNGSNQIIFSGWAANPSGAGATLPVAGSTGFGFIWGNRTTLAYQ